jgi:phage host-nuclease inhibitor protein Gam
MLAVEFETDIEKEVIQIPAKYSKQLSNKKAKVIVMFEDDYELWNKDELENIGKIGLNSKSFVEDSEDYTKW